MALRSKRLKPEWSRIVALGWALACLSLLAAAVPIPTLPRNATERAERIKKIANMTAEERMRLEANFRQWLALPEARRDELRLLVAELQTDRKNHGTLEDLADQYYDWLGTLPPTAIEALRKEQEPRKRVLLVKSLMEKQTGAVRPATRLRPVITAELQLSPADRKNVLKAADHLPLRIRQQLIGLNDLERLWKLTVITCRHAFAGDQRLLPGQFQDPVAPLINAIEEPLRSKLTADESKQHQKLFLLLLRTTLAELSASLPDPNSPEGRALLEQYFVTLDSQTQDAAMREPPERFWGELVRRYAEGHRLPLIDPEWFEVATNPRPDPAQRNRIGRLMRLAFGKDGR